MKILMIGGGGAGGALCRYALAGWAQSLSKGLFPVGTLTVNLAGCFVIGFVGAWLAGPLVIREEYRLALLVGFVGAFTTFSTFGFETMSLLNDGQRTVALLNVLVSNVAGLALVWCGYRLAEWCYGG